MLVLWIYYSSLRDSETLRKPTALDVVISFILKKLDNILADFFWGEGGDRGDTCSTSATWWYRHKDLEENVELINQLKLKYKILNEKFCVKTNYVFGQIFEVVVVSKTSEIANV